MNVARYVGTEEEMLDLGRAAEFAGIDVLRRAMQRRIEELRREYEAKPQLVSDGLVSADFRHKLGEVASLKWVERLLDAVNECARKAQEEK